MKWNYFLCSGSSSAEISFTEFWLSLRGAVIWFCYGIQAWLKQIVVLKITVATILYIHEDSIGNMQMGYTYLLLGAEHIW